MSLKIDRLQLEIIIDNDQSRKQLRELEEEMNNLKQAMRKVPEGSKEWEQMNTRLKSAKVQHDKVIQSIGIHGLSLKELSQRQRELNMIMLNMDPRLDEYKKLEQQYKEITARQAELRSGMKNTQKAMNSIGATIKNTLLPMLAAAFSFQAVIGFVTKIVEVRKEFEKYEAVLANTFGDKSRAKQSLQMIQEFAAKTPFQVMELTNAFVKLANQGFIPTRDEMRKLGDVAASTGKTFDMLTEAIIDAQVGEFERLKEFGIRAQKQGDQVTFTFKGVKTQVDFTADSIRNYILALGDAQGVSGSMDAISKTLGGRISNMGDAWDNLLNSMGQNTSGAFMTAIGWITKLIDTLAMAQKSIAQIVIGVSANQNAENIKNAQEQIDVMTKSLIKNGMTQEEASKRAYELYKQSTELTLTGMQEKLDYINTNMPVWKSEGFTANVKAGEEEVFQLKQQISKLKIELEGLNSIYGKNEGDKTNTSSKGNAAPKSIIPMPSKEELDAYWKDVQNQNDMYQDLFLLDWEEEQKKKITIDQQVAMQNFDNLQKNFARDKQARETAYLEELASLGNNEEAKKALTTKYKQDQLQFEYQHLLELKKLAEILTLDISLLSDEDKEKYLARIEELKNALAQLKVEMVPEDDSTTTLADMLGMSDEEIETLIGKIQVITSAISESLSGINQIITNSENQQFQKFADSNEKKKKLLKQRLDSGIITQDSYNKQVAALDEELDKKKRKLEHDQAVRAKALAIIQAVINVAQGITAALSQMPPASYIMAAITGVLGAIQIAAISSQPIPSYAIGKYDVKGMDGNTYQAGYEPRARTGMYHRPTLIGGLGLVGERAPEMVIDGPTLSNIQMNAPEIIQAIHAMRVPQYATGRYPEVGQTVSNQSKTVQQADSMTALLREISAKLDNPTRAKIVWSDWDDANTEITDIKNSVSK